MKHSQVIPFIALLAAVYLCFFSVIYATESVTLSTVKAVGRRAYCLERSYPGSEPLPQEILEFLEGFIIGIETEIGNITKCTQDAKITLEDFEKAIASFKYGFSHLSVKSIEQGFIELSNGIEEIAVAIRDCNVTALVEDLTKLAEDLKSGLSGIIKIIVDEAINIFHHSKEITGDIKSFISFWEQRKWQLAGVQLGKVVGILLNYRA